MSAVREARVPAVVKSIVVRLRPEQAFELFTAGLSRWWPLKTHSCAGVDALRVDIEPRVGGQVLEEARNGTQAAWGTVLAWDPPRHFAMTWHPGAGPAEATRLEVSFAAEGNSSCRVEVVHSGWEARGPRAEELRENYDKGWVSVLAAYSSVIGRATGEST